MPLENRGHGGDECSATAAIVRKYSPRPGDTVAIEASVNDTRRYGLSGLDRYRTCVTTMLRHLGDRPDQVLLVADPPIVGWSRYPPWNHGSDRVSRAYRDATRQLARRAGVTFVDLSTGWVKRRHVGDDTIHPSDAGHRLIARRVVDATRR